MNDYGQTPIFFDETRRRWSIVSVLFIVAGVVCLFASLCFAVSIALSPQLPVLSLARAAASLGLAPALPQPHRMEYVRITAGNGHPVPDLRMRGRQRYVLTRNTPLQVAKQKLNDAIAAETVSKPIPAAAIAPGHVSGPVRAAFYVNYDKPSLDSLQEHVGQMTHMMADWLLLSPDGANITSIAAITPDSVKRANAETYSATNDDQAIMLARSHGVAILPMLQNYGSSDGNEDHAAFQNNWLHNLLLSPAKRTAVILQLRQFVTQGGYQGVNVDFETDRADDRAGLTAFMSELSTTFHPRGLLVTQDVQTDSDAYDLPSLARVDDFLVPMLYDQHSDGGAAGSIAGQSWFVSQMSNFLQQVPANKTVLGIGGYGYDWADGTQSASDVSFQDAAQLAQENRNEEDGIIRIDPASLTPYFTYSDDSGPKEVSHTVWLEDATTTWNEIHAAQPYHPLGAALWRLGSEDPSLWSFFGKDQAATLNTFDPKQLSQVTYGKEFGITFQGEGDVLDIVGQPEVGHRVIAVNTKTHLINGEDFVKYPSQWVIRRTGLVDQKTGANTSKAIALTFDDGPDPRWTPQILDILHQYHVPATFFVVGENAEAHPGLLAREWNDGMEIGNHSFTHPEVDNISPLRIKLELDATQRVIEAMTGHMTMLWRAPNRADSEPSTPADFDPIEQGDKLGYLFIGEKIDPTDWKPGIKAAQIIANVLANANNGNCVLLHDAGGDTRAETVTALPLIIQGLKAKGYHFVTVSALIGRPRSQLFPAVTGQQRWAVDFDRAMFDMSYWVGNGFALLFIIAIVLGIVRILFIGTLASIQAKQEHDRVFDPSYSPTVSVIIAAYNEAKVVNKTIATLLASDYPDLDILVVDDGSKDDTAEIVRADYGTHPRVRILKKPNGGKASALNIGIKACRGEIVVALDADTMFAPDTVSKLVRHFSDPMIGAVSGNVKVGNRNNPLTIWQAVEYITSQNFDRRAFDLLNCITVVPGAVGAWRKDAVILAGLYSSQTLAEDTDLTFKIRKLGYKIVTDNAALAYTEAPDTIKDLAKQRFRWAFGTLQCLWKHRSALFNPRYGAFGTIAMPSLWVYQIGFQAIAPVVDLTIAWSLFYSKFIAPNTSHQNATMLLGYWALFSAVELLGAWLAFRLDRENKRLLIWLPLQRFVYRQLMYYVIVKSLVIAVRGSLVGWGKFERKGTVRQPHSPSTESPASAPRS